MESVRKQAEEKKEYLIGIRRELHRNPELSMKEYHTAQRIEEELDRFGIEHRRIGETGVCGFIKGEKEGGKIIALRADMDALPIEEMADVEYKSVNKGVMHACGHDVHTACLLGAAGILNERRKDFSGEVRLFFQQGEEVGGGGRLFARDKVFQDVSRVFGLHTAPDLRCGTVGVKSGINNASVDHFVMEIEGKSAHVCAPHLGADALFIASQIVVSLQAVTARMTSPTEPVVIGIGKLQAGTAYNTVASNAVLEGTTRNISEENRTRINTLVQKTAEHIAAIYGGRVKMIWEDFAPPLVNDASVCEEVKTAIREISEEIAIVTDRELYLSGDDFAMLQLHVPGVYAYLGTFNPDIPQTQNQYHSDCFTVDEDALVIGAALYAGCALWWLQH